MSDVNDVCDLGLRRPVEAPHLRSLQRATEEHAQFEKAPLGTHKEVAGLAGEHDRFVRCINPLIAEGNGGLAQPFPSIPQLLREILGQSRFGGRPAIVLFSFLDPLLAVVAFSTGHNAILMAILLETGTANCFALFATCDFYHACVAADHVTFGLFPLDARKWTYLGDRILVFFRGGVDFSFGSTDSHRVRFSSRTPKSLGWANGVCRSSENVLF